MVWLTCVTSILACILAALLFLVIRSRRILIRECRAALTELLNGNFMHRSRLSGDLGSLLERVTAMLLTWVSNTLQCSLSVTDAVNDISHASGVSRERVTSIGGRVKVFTEKARGDHDRLKEAASISEKIAQKNAEIVLASRKTIEGLRGSEDAIRGGKKTVEEAVRILSFMGDSMEALVTEISRLSGVTEKADELVSAVNELVGRIDMLALNASIEAARAGEHGRGFAVVAEEVGKLSVQGASYARSIAGRLQEIRNETSRATESVRNLAEVSRRGRSSAASVQDQFEKISGYVGDTVRVLDGFAEQMRDQADSILQISTINEGLSAFFGDFIQEAENISTDIGEQEQREEKNLGICRLMDDASRRLSDFSRQFEKAIAQRLLAHCERVRDRLAAKDLDNQKLAEYARRSGVSEFYITDGDGVIRLSNSAPAIGFRFPEDPGSQAYEFRQILKNPAKVVVQPFKMRDLDGKYFKIVGLSRRDGRGIAQAGLNVEDLVNLRL